MGMRITLGQGEINQDIGIATSLAATGMTTGLAGIGLAPDNNSLYVAANTGILVEHFDLAGNLLGSFNRTSSSAASFLTVVPAAPPAPEPTSAALLLSGGAFLAMRRRRG